MCTWNWTWNYPLFKFAYSREGSDSGIVLFLTKQELVNNFVYTLQLKRLPSWCRCFLSLPAKNSSSKAVNNSQKPISKKPSGVALQAAPNVTATATQLPIQLQPLQFHQTTQLSQQIMANLIATDAQGKPVPILSANQHLLPSLSFQSGQSQVVQGMMTLAGDEGKGAQTTPLLQQQPALALSIPQQGTNPPVRLQGPGLSSTGGQSQSVLSSSSEVR